MTSRLSSCGVSSGHQTRQAFLSSLVSLSLFCVTVSGISILFELNDRIDKFNVCSPALILIPAKADCTSPPPSPNTPLRARTSLNTSTSRQWWLTPSLMQSYIPYLSNSSIQWIAFGTAHLYQSRAASSRLWFCIDPSLRSQFRTNIPLWKPPHISIHIYEYPHQGRDTDANLHLEVS